MKVHRTEIDLTDNTIDVTEEILKVDVVIAMMKGLIISHVEESLLEYLIKNLHIKLKV